MITRSYDMDFGEAGMSLNMGGSVNLTFADDGNLTGNLSFSQNLEAPPSGCQISATLQGKLDTDKTPTGRLHACGEITSWNLGTPENDSAPLNQEITITFSADYAQAWLSGLENLGTIALDLAPPSEA